MSKFTEKDVKKYLNDGNFCIAPWVHIQNTPEGVPQPCCIFKPNIMENKSKNVIHVTIKSGFLEMTRKILTLPHYWKI